MFHPKSTRQAPHLNASHRSELRSSSRRGARVSAGPNRSDRMGSDADPSDAADAARARPGGEDGAVAINVRCSSGSKIAVAASLGSTIGAFKSALARDCDVPADQQRLIYKGRILKDDQTLASYGTSFPVFFR